MDLLMQESSGTWTTVPGLLQGLRAAAASGDSIMVHLADPAIEIGEAVALIGVFRSYGGQSERLSVASPYPAPDWIARVRASGIERIWYVVPDIRPLRLRLESRDLIEVPKALCPALHVRKLDGCPTSVCGNMLDRLVLARRMLVGQCFGPWRDCRWAVAAATRRREPCISSLSAADASDRPSPSPAPSPVTTLSSSTPMPAPSASWERDSTG